MIRDEILLGGSFTKVHIAQTKCLRMSCTILKLRHVSCSISDSRFVRRWARHFHSLDDDLRFIITIVSLDISVCASFVFKIDQSPDSWLIVV